MSESKLSILGLYDYGQMINNDLFENLNLPRGINKEETINNILEQCAGFEVIYPDYEYMKISIGLWSKRWYRTFEKWLNALSIKYEPLWNFDRTEEYIDTENKTAHGESENKGYTKTTDSVDEKDTNSVVAYNSDKLHIKEQDIIDRNGSSTSDDTISGTADTKEDRKFTHTAKLYGNIGVTTSQQMLEAELEIAKWNLMQNIVDCFKVDFCILVY